MQAEEGLHAPFFVIYNRVRIIASPLWYAIAYNAGFYAKKGQRVDRAPKSLKSTI